MAVFDQDELERLKDKGVYEDRIDELQPSNNSESEAAYRKSVNRANKNRLGNKDQGNKPQKQSGDDYEDQQSKSGDIASERAALGKKLGQTAKTAHEEDMAGLYKGKKGKSPSKSKSALSDIKKNLKIAGGVIGVGGTILGIALGIFGFLNSFKLDHILANVEVETFVHFNAQFSRRSDNYLRGYMRARLGQYEGTHDADSNLFFRGSSDDLNPITRQWYTTMLGNESAIFGNDVIFTSMVQPDGTIKPARINLAGSNIDFLVDDALVQQARDGDIDAVNRLGASIDNELDVQLFDNDQAARRSLRADLRKRTRWYQVLKRRRTRKVIQSVTGIRDWRMFEKTHERVDKRLFNMQRKVLRKVFPDSTRLGRFMGCILGSNACSGSDPNNPDNLDPNAHLDPDADNTRTDGTRVDTDGDGVADSVVDGSDTDLGEGDEIVDEAFDEVFADPDPNAPGDGSLPGNLKVAQYIRRFITSRITRSASSVWALANVITDVHNLLKGGEDSALSRMVYANKQAQLIGYSTALGIGRDQLKRGGLVADELNDFYALAEGAENSEGWLAVIGQRNVVGAQSVSGFNTNDICNTPSEERGKTGFAPYCPAFKPGSSRGASAAVGYSESAFFPVGQVIAASVGAVNDSIIGGIFDVVEGVVGEVVSPIVSGLLTVFPAVTDLAAQLGELLVNYVGAGPIWDFETNDFINVLVGGMVGTAATHTRQMGGIFTNLLSYEDQQFNKQMVADYIEDEASTTSFYDKFASLSNQRSIASRMLFGVSVLSTHNLASSFTSTFTTGNLFGNLVGVASAQNNIDNELNELTGQAAVEMPAVCFGDVFDRTNPADMTNADEVLGIPITWDLVSDNTNLFEAVYAELEGDDNAESVAETIYNCAEFDKQVMEALGATSGFTVDDGLSDSESIGTGRVESRETTYTPEGCPTSAVLTEGTEIVSIPNSIGGTVQVHTCMVEAMTNLFNDATAAGVPLSGYGWRSNSTQERLRSENCGGPGNIYNASASCNPDTALPGNSNHQKGTAIDFRYNGSTICYNHSAAWCAENGNNAGFIWLQQNAAKYGLTNLPSEAWHWSMGGG